MPSTPASATTSDPLDLSTVRFRAAGDPFCCLALTFEQRQRFGIDGRTCSPERCARLDDEQPTTDEHGKDDQR